MTDWRSLEGAHADCSFFLALTLGGPLASFRMFSVQSTDDAPRKAEGDATDQVCCYQVSRILQLLSGEVERDIFYRNMQALETSVIPSTPCALMVSLLYPTNVSGKYRLREQQKMPSLHRTCYSDLLPNKCHRFTVVLESS